MNVISDTAQRLLHQELSEREGQIAVWHVFNLSHQMHFENNDQNEGRLQLVSDRLSPPSLSAHAGVHAPSPTHPECHRVHTPATPEGSGVRAPSPTHPECHRVTPLPLPRAQGFAPQPLPDVSSLIHTKCTHTCAHQGHSAPKIGITHVKGKVYGW